MQLEKYPKLSIALSLMIAAAAVAAWCDIEPVLRAQARLDALTTPAKLARINDDILREGYALDRCATMSTDYKDYRACMIPVMKEVSTDWFVWFSIWVNHTWIADHPEDNEILAAAKLALDAGWNELAREEPLFDAADAVNDAVANSKLVTLVDPMGTGHWDRARRTHDMQEAEAMVYAPEVIRRKEQEVTKYWNTMVYAPEFIRRKEQEETKRRTSQDDADLKKSLTGSLADPAR
jgi:hypothetical protein